MDQIIYDKCLGYKSVPLYLLDEHVPRSKLTTQYLEPVKDISYLEDAYIGYSADQVTNSLFLSIRSIQYAYGCQLSNSKELRQQIVSKLKNNPILPERLSIQ